MKAHKVDNLIVGGGLSGWSLAYWLKQFRPNQSTMVLHSSLPKLSPASVRNAGFLTVGSLNFYMQNREEQGDHFAQEILHFCKDNHAVLKAEGLLGKCPSYIHNGSYSITSLEIESPPRQFERVSDFNLPTAIGESVWHCAFDGSVDPEQLMRALKQKAGAMSQDTEVTHVDHNRVESVSAEFQAEKVFVATNAWTNWLLQQPKVHPTRAQALRTSPLAKGKITNYYFSDELAYVRVCKDRRLVVGGMRSLAPEIEETEQLELNPLIQGALLEFVKRRFGAELKVEKQWSGIMGFSENYLPLAGEKDNLLFQAGFSGHGMGMAFLVAKNLVEWVLKGKPLPRWSQFESNS